jgi:hypothetical protein
MTIGTQDINVLALTDSFKKLSPYSETYRKRRGFNEDNIIYLISNFR